MPMQENLGQLGGVPELTDQLPQSQPSSAESAGEAKNSVPPLERYRRISSAVAELNAAATTLGFGGNVHDGVFDGEHK
jgi:hypothetical protein